MTRFNDSGLPHDGPEREEAEQLYEDFLNRAAEELEIEKEKNIKKEEPMDIYLRKLTESFDAMGRLIDSEKYKNVKNRMSTSGSENLWVDLETKDVQEVESENINIKKEEENE